MFRRSYEDKMYDTQDIFQTEYTDFDNNDGSFDGDGFRWKSKDIIDGKIHLWHQKYSLLAPGFLVFLYV